MNWNRLDHISKLDAIVEASRQQPQLVFKHSTRCSISAAAKHRLELRMHDLLQQFSMHFLDLILHRDVSDEVAHRLACRHESPQVLVIVNGRAVINVTHYDIEANRLLQQILAYSEISGSNPS